MPSADPVVTVVLPVRNGDRYVGDALAAIERQTLPPEKFETIVVDDGSIDGTPDLLASWREAHPGRRVVLRRGGNGPAAARNAGIAAARAEWVAFTDADTIPDELWLEQLLAAGEDADAVEGRVVARAENGAPRADVHTLENETGGQYVTANMAYRRATLERVSGFDESFRDAFLEDSDLAFRVLDSGGRIVFAPDAVVAHRVIPSSPLGTLRAARKMRWLPLLARKHPARYRAEIAPRLKPVTRPDAHVLAGIGGLALLPFGGAPLVAGALLAANGARVIGRSPRMRVPLREMPTAAAVSVAIPVAKVGWWLVGWASLRRP